MPESNSAGFQEIANPFEKDKMVGIVKALSPDISIVHACISDEMGNTVLAVPYGDDLWGALASRTVLVTVEKVVSAGGYPQTFGSGKDSFLYGQSGLPGAYGFTSIFVGQSHH